MKLNTRELETVEYKMGLNERKQAIESLAAFASVRGGKVIIGIAPDGRRVGVNVGKGTLEQFANDVKTNTKPPLFPSIDQEGPDEDCVLTVQVGESAVKPVWAYHIPYKRVGRTNQKLEPERSATTDGHFARTHLGYAAGGKLA